MPFWKSRDREQRQPVTDTYKIGSRPEHDDAIASIRARREQRAADEAARLESMTPYQRAVHEMAKEKGPDVPVNPYRRDFNRRESFFARHPYATLYSLALIASGALAVGHGLVSDATYGKDRAEEYLEQRGYTGVEHTDTNIIFIGWQGCGEGDGVRYKFDATALNGEEVAVLVCKGLFKGATERQQ